MRAPSAAFALIAGFGRQRPPVGTGRVPIGNSMVGATGGGAGLLLTCQAAGVSMDPPEAECRTQPAGGGEEDEVAGGGDVGVPPAGPPPVDGRSRSTGATIAAAANAAGKRGPHARRAPRPRAARRLAGRATGPAGPSPRGFAKG